MYDQEETPLLSEGLSKHDGKLEMIQNYKKNPGGTVEKNLPTNAGLDPCSGKIPHATEQLLSPHVTATEACMPKSPHTTTTEPLCCNH